VARSRDVVCAGRSGFVEEHVLTAGEAGATGWEPDALCLTAEKRIGGATSAPGNLMPTVGRNAQPLRRRHDALAMVRASPTAAARHIIAQGLPTVRRRQLGDAASMISTAR